MANPNVVAVSSIYANTAVLVIYQQYVAMKK